METRKQMCVVIAWLPILLLGTAMPAARGDLLLAEINLAEAGGTSGTFDGFADRWFDDEHFYYGTGEVWEFFGTWDIDDIGQTRTASFATPGFASFADQLTNGNDDPLHHQFLHFPGGGGSGEGRYESGWLEMHVTAHGPDLYGWWLNRFTMTLNDMTINHHNGWTDYSYGVTYRLFPEPISFGILALGVLAVWQRRARR